DEGHVPAPVGVAVARKILARLAAVGWTLALGVWIAASILSRKALAYAVPHSGILRIARTVLAVASLTIAVAVAYKGLPSRPPRWKQALKGATLTALLVSFGSWLLELWFTRVNVGAG